MKNICRFCGEPLEEEEIWTDTVLTDIHLAYIVDEIRSKNKISRWFADFFKIDIFGVKPTSSLDLLERHLQTVQMSQHIWDRFSR